MGNFFFVTMFSIVFMSAVYCACAKDTCNSHVSACEQTCMKRTSKCPRLDCGNNTNSCTQYCLKSGAKCGMLQCKEKVKNCKQFCFDCPTATKMICSSETCEQTCKGENCVMECTDKVKKCKQICTDGGMCTLTCHNNTECESSCSNATCKYGQQTKQPEVPLRNITSRCNEERCEETCSGDCKETVLSCNNTKLCNLACDNGCKMECSETVSTCNQHCRGSTPCSHVCDSKVCKIKKAVSTTNSADHLMYHVILVISFPVSVFFIIP